MMDNVLVGAFLAGFVLGLILVGILGAARRRRRVPEVGPWRSGAVRQAFRPRQVIDVNPRPLLRPLSPQQEATLRWQAEQDLRAFDTGWKNPKLEQRRSFAKNDAGQGGNQWQ